jgi:hypothetical protein
MLDGSLGSGQQTVKLISWSEEHGSSTPTHLIEIVKDL